MNKEEMPKIQEEDIKGDIKVLKEQMNILNNQIKSLIKR